MNREAFAQVVEEVLESLPAEFKQRLENIAILIEDVPANQRRRTLSQRPGPKPSPPQRLLMGVFEGVPRTKKSVFDLPMGPDRIVLYQKNIEAVCASEAEIRREIRLTVIHELGHYFGMSEDQLKDV
jgi:predicted Zn-dependent protease with MMP-like domain